MKTKGADGKEYYVPTDDTAGLLSLEYAQALQSMVREAYYKDFEAKNAIDDATRLRALRAQAQIPVDYFKDLEDITSEKNSNLVDYATKAQVRHSAGMKLIAAPTSGAYFDLLSGKSRGIMSRDTMGEILRKLDKNEDEEQHKQALLRYAKAGLGLNLSDDLSTNDIINKMLDVADVDRKGFDAKTARGFKATGARYPLLNVFNVPGMEFFVSSKGDFASRKTRTNSLDETPMMLGAELMTLFNADVDGDMAYAMFSMLDAAAGAMSPEQYEKVMKTQDRLQEYSNHIMEKMKKRAAMRPQKALETDVIKGSNYAALGDATEKRLGAAIAGMASRKNFAEVGKFDNLRQMVQNFERATSGSLWTGGKMDADSLYDYLVATEFSTIFSQEGISSKKVFDKIMTRLDQSNNTEWAKMTPEEKQGLLQNQFVQIYDRLKESTTFTREGLNEIGTMLRDWGLIEEGADVDVASAGRADQLMAIMAEFTGDDKWLDKKLTWDELVERVLKYNESIKGRRYATDKGYRVNTGGLADLFKYGKRSLLPNSTVANIHYMGGTPFSQLTTEQQAKLFKDLRMTPETAAKKWGLTPNQAQAVAEGKAAVDVMASQLAYVSMAGYSGGEYQNLVDAALRQYDRTKRNPHYIRPSGLGKPLAGPSTPNAPENRDGQIRFWDQIRNLWGYDYQAIRSGTTFDQRKSLLSQYNLDFMDTNRGQLNNIAQILAMHGRKGDGSPAEIKEVWDAYKRSGGSEADMQKALEKLGISSDGAKAIASEFMQQTTTREELIAASVKELGLDESKNWSVDAIQKEAAELAARGSDAQAASANKVLAAIDLHAQGGGPAQLLANLEALEALTMANDLNLNPDSPKMMDSVMKMIDTSANALNGFKVVGREQNLIGFLDDTVNGANEANRIAALAGSSDLILAKEGGGVRIADYKAVRGIPKQMQAKYLAQLLGYGYAYNQMRDNILTKGYKTYEDYLKSGESNLYTRMKGGPISKELFELMQSDAGYLDELAINYTDAFGNERVYVGKYDDLANSAQGQALMGWLLQEKLHPGQNVAPPEAMQEMAQSLINERVMKSTGPNEYVDRWSGKDSKEAVAKYKELLTERRKISKEEQKIKKMAGAVGESLYLGGDAEKDSSYQAAYRKSEARIEQINLEMQAIEGLGEAVSKEINLLKEESKAQADVDALTEETTAKKEAQKAAYETFNQSLKDYTGYAQQMVQLEKKAQRATGSDRILLENQMEMLRGYADESLANLNEDTIKQMSPEQRKKTLVAAERAKKQMDLAAAGMGGGEKQGIFSQFASGLKGGMARSFGFSMLGYRLAGYLGGTIKKILGYAAQLDQAMVNIQIVTGKTRDGAFSLIDSYNDLAKQLGSTTLEVANSANVWLRQGYSVNKVNELITSSLYLSKLGMLDTATAARDLTGIIKGFKLEVSDATDVVSKLTMIDQNAAVSAGNIATAMQQVSASAQQAGLDIDTTMGYISTIADVSQRDPSSVGASLRTIISRYGTVKAGAFAGMGIDNTTDDLENINDIEKVLRRLGISIRTSTMEFKGLDDVLGTVASRWNEWSSVERNAVNC